MAEKSYGFAKTEDGVELPYVEQGGHKRFLAVIPTPHDHPMLSLVPTWEQGVSAGALPDIPFKDVPEFDRVRTDVPILDQDGRGACVAHAVATAVMIARSVSGAPFRHLSPWQLYSLINGGRDGGSNSGDAMQALRDVGICDDSLVPYATIRPSGYNAAAKADAARCKLRVCYQIKGFEQAVVAAWLGYGVAFDLRAGAGFDVDSNGVCRFLGFGWNNHEVFAGEQYRTVNGSPVIGGRNSWGTQWGVQGRCYWTPKHLDNSDQTFAVAFMTDDPQDSEMPPVLT